MSEAVDLEAVKRVQQQTWSEGDFSMVASTTVLAAERLAEAVDVLPGERVLDVACGSGNTTIAVARRFARATGVDYVPDLLARGRERAAAERVRADFVEGDAEALPFDDGRFDAVVSTFGSMFAPDQPRAASELLRVCRQGGRIGMTNWTPDGFVGQVFRAVTSHVPPPAPIDPPSLWGTEDRLQELLGPGTESIRAEPRTIAMRFGSAAHWLQFYKHYFGPIRVAYSRLDEAGQDALSRDLTELLNFHNRSGDAALVVDSEYLEVVAVRS